jgi:low affinity Fe/Cu permease
VTERFATFARRVSDLAGRPAAFIAACALILAWLACGPLFGYSDTWQLIINTGTTIVTFLMVFLIQSSTNRSEQALQVKLDELIHATDNADDALIDIESDSEQHLAAVREAARANKP